MRNHNILVESDDAKVLAVLFQHGLVGKMEPPKGFDSCSTRLVHDDCYTLIVYNNTPGDSGYLMYGLPRKQWSKKEAVNLFRDLLRHTNKDTKMQFKEVTVTPL